MICIAISLYASFQSVVYDHFPEIPMHIQVVYIFKESVSFSRCCLKCVNNISAFILPLPKHPFRAGNLINTDLSRRTREASMQQGTKFEHFIHSDVVKMKEKSPTRNRSIYKSQKVVKNKSNW